MVLLPKNVRPVRYAISLTPDLIACTFTGREEVEVDIKEETSTVIFHSHQLSISEVSIQASGATHEAVGLDFDLKAQTVTFRFPAKLPVGSAKLRAAFTGTLNDDMAGFYRSKYTLRGESRWAAVTQFEATDARRCFPCIDEPAVKAVYAITVTAPADRTVISNMHAIRVSTSADGKQRTHEFADTPVMSTYLAAVFVGDFDCLSTVTSPSRIPTSIYTPVGQTAQGTFALKVASEGIEYLQKLFGVPFMGTKCDHIAIASFAAGAMENMGAISYREAALLIDEANSSLAQKQRVAQEGFAKHMEYQVTSNLFPEWDVWASFTASVQSSAFSLDCMATTHPVEVEVQTPEQINEIFDVVSYHKGASVIRMMFQYLGTEVGFRGLNGYLTKHAYSNAVTEDLWASLEAASGQPVSKVMRKWTAFSGYPYLHVSSNAAGDLCVSSARFIAPYARNGDAWPAADDFATGASVEAFAAAARKYAVPPKDEKDKVNCNDDWCMPLSVVSDKGVTKPGVLLLDPEADATTSRSDKLAKASAELTAVTKGTSWFKFNAGHTNFYRTVYDVALLEKLKAAVAASGPGAQPALASLDRIGIVGDVSAAVSVGMTPAAALLSFLLAFQHETDYHVWSAILDATSDLRATAESMGAEPVAALDGYMRHLLRQIVATVGWEAKPGEHANTPLLRASVLRIAAISGMQEVVAEALARFDAYAAGKGTIAADLKQLVYNTAASHGGEGRWVALLKLFKEASMSEEQRRLMTALGRAADPALLSRALAMMLTDDVRSQDAAFLLGAVASNPGAAGRDLAWKFIKDNWAECTKRWGSTGFLWSSMLGSATRHFDSKAAADEIAAWFKSHPAGSAERTVSQSIEAIRTRAWKAHVLARDNGSGGGFIAACKAASS